MGAARPLAAALLLLLPARSLAQQSSDDGHARHPALGAYAIALGTHAAPALHGENRTEAYLTQPTLAARYEVLGARLRVQGMLSLEGLTLERGELTHGAWGEGYMDRRHPHTYLHELIATGVLHAGDAAFSLTFGKGMAPFGTDDPSVRPFVKYPVNHHLAQVMERLVAIAAARYGPVVAEVGVFNGDEPAAPTDNPVLDHFGDSRAARLTLLPVHGLELALSYAFVRSPEEPTRTGLDARKWSAAARLERAVRGHAVYALLEWARTQEYDGTRLAFTFPSVLVEAAAQRGRMELAARYENTVRPEEERLADPFRSPRPHLDFNILGQTRWHILTLRAGRQLAPSSRARFAPFVEISYARPLQELEPSVFVPREFYGADRLWSVSAGIRFETGTLHRRMGRYGVAAPQANHS